MTTSRVHLPATTLRDSSAVAPLELFFDLVFVFALTQVTASMADDLTAAGLVKGLLVVGLLWWSWTGYAWLGNLVRADQGLPRLAMFAAMAVMFVLALSIPEAFDDLPGGMSGPVVVALCYLAFRTLHLVLYYVSAAGDAGLRRQLLRFAPSMVVATALLLAAAGTDGTAQVALWTAALTADYAGTWLGGATGWRIRSATHFTERHGLIVIVALGESIVAIGVGVAALPISWPIVVGSALGLALSGALWSAYFDTTAPLAEHALVAATEQQRAALARDAYSYLHLPMVAGVVLLALGLKKVLEQAGNTGTYDLTDPLTGVGLGALVGGAVLYLLAHVAFRLRMVGELDRRRLAVALLLVPLGAAGSTLPALASLAVLTTTVVALVVVETLWDGRADRRPQAAPQA